MELYLRIVVEVAIFIPLVVALVKYVKESVQEKNWQQLLSLTMNLIEEAEKKFEDGSSKKEWVMSMVKASADTINYKYDDAQLSQLIDDIIAVTNIVNADPEINPNDVVDEITSDDEIQG